MPSGRREAYDQLLTITKMLDSSLVELCQTVIAQLPDLPEPQRTNVANALSRFATTLRDELERGGNFLKLAKTLETQAKDLHESSERLAYVRKEIQKIYRGVSETSALRTQLVTLDEHLATIERTFAPNAPLTD